MKTEVARIFCRTVGFSPAAHCTAICAPIYPEAGGVNTRGETSMSGRLCIPPLTPVLLAYYSSASTSAISISSSASADIASWLFQSSLPPYVPESLSLLFI